MHSKEERWNPEKKYRMSVIVVCGICLFLLAAILIIVLLDGPEKLGFICVFLLFANALWGANFVLSYAIEAEEYQERKTQNKEQ